MNLEHIIENFISKDFRDCHLVDTIRNIQICAGGILNTDNILIWFESEEDKEKYWSYIDKNRIYLEKSKIDPLFGENRTVLISEENNREILEELRKAPYYPEQVENILFHKIQYRNYHTAIVIEIINFSNRKVQWTKDVSQLLSILSLFVAQTVKMKNISEIANYYFQEQEKAYQKQTKILQNDLESVQNLDIDIFYKPSDILSGDSYSIYTTSTGDIFVYIVDAMGHGIAPSLTAYSISAVIKNKIKSSNSFNELMEVILDNIQYILTDEEQLTCGLFWFKSDFSEVQYVVAGMYPPMILDGDNVVLTKANNIPFMNFAFDFNISTVKLTDFKSFLIFTDGLVEDSEDLGIDLDRLLRDREYLQKSFEKLDFMNLEDDTTIIRISKKEE